MPPTRQPYTFTVSLDSIVGPCKLEVTQHEISLWTAKVIGYDSCIADGNSKDDAVRQSIILYLHVKIGQIRRGNWMPRYRKETS